MEQLKRKVEMEEHELLNKISHGKMDMNTFKMIEMYNELCEFKMNISKQHEHHASPMPHTMSTHGNPY
jgi:hypothetical protein